MSPVAVRNVLISDAVDQSCVDLLKANNINVTCKYKLPKPELIAEIANYDGLIVRSDTKVTPDVISAGTSLRVIGRAGTGVDNIDITAATKKGIIVLNTPGGNSISACELTCALITCLARHVTQGCTSLKEGRWDRKLFSGEELYGKTLAIIGLGRIGREVAVRMQAFGMRTVGFDPIITKEQALSFNVEKKEVEEIWPIADYITVHTPLIPQTRNFINDDVFGKCKHGVRIVNVARGGIIDETALLNAIKNGTCGGAALDVFEEEPPKNPVTLELIKHPKVIVTPHLGASTAEAQQRVAVEIAEQFIALTNTSSGYTITGAVNAPILTASRDPFNQAWITLTTRISKIAGKLIKNESLKEISVKVTTEGNGLEKMNFLSTAAMVGILSGRTKNGLNLINAPVLANEAGLKVQVNHVASDKHNVTVVVSSPNTTHEVKGNVHVQLYPLLSEIDEASFGQFGVPLSDDVHVLSGSDPGDIFNILSSFSKAGIQIFNMSVASNSRGDNWYLTRTQKPIPSDLYIQGVTIY